ncbi:14956_t:CDS:2 [Funneliformis mosseae]|uniref:14956_t:CDS:1 n=1 Tax=Funneliformis mosseae TaxID=27381 RepID=A0A9N9CC62_FUNMO|nr:14956_t:CDS:2 [Funneliformis mosseae]
MVPEEYPPKDGFENNRQLNEIGYTEIYSDTNNLVISGALLILFPPSPPFGWLSPTAVDMFKNKLDNYGDIFWNVFTTIRSGESNFSFFSGLFKEAFEPSQGLKK